jgi:hypothetical protein
MQVLSHARVSAVDLVSDQPSAMVVLNNATEHVYGDTSAVYQLGLAFDTLTYQFTTADAVEIWWE